MNLRRGAQCGEYVKDDQGEVDKDVSKKKLVVCPPPPMDRDFMQLAHGPWGASPWAAHTAQGS